MRRFLPAFVLLAVTATPAVADVPEDWAFKAFTRPAVPTVKGAVRTPIDAFVLARLEAKNLRFAPDADRRTLIRRLTFDLHGLPPTPEEVAAFVTDTAADAYEKLVDRLLASPRYHRRGLLKHRSRSGPADPVIRVLDGLSSSSIIGWIMPPVQIVCRAAWFGRGQEGKPAGS
jgi:hypothetical protein